MEPALQMAPTGPWADVSVKLIYVKICSCSKYIYTYKIQMQSKRGEEKEVNELRILKLDKI